MILQERIEELNSGILKFIDNKINLIGFMSPERLEDYYIRNIQCFFSNGIYNVENLDFAYIKDNALFILIKDNMEFKKFQFELLKKDTVQFKNELNKPLSKVYYIRKCKYSKLYNYKDSDISLLFKTLDELNKFFEDKYKTQLILTR